MKEHIRWKPVDVFKFTESRKLEAKDASVEQSVLNSICVHHDME